MSNKEIARILQETADLIELTGGNPYRARAFSRAARSLSSLEDSVSKHLDGETLTEIDGVGEAMADHIEKVYQSGSFQQYDELLNAVPPGLLDVLRVNGLGTKRTRRLWKELDITSLEDLEAAAEEDRIQELDGFGRKTQEKLLKSVHQLRRYDAQWHYAKAITSVRPLLRHLRSIDDIHRAEVTGALRRQMETVEQIELLVATGHPGTLVEALDDFLEAPPDRTDRIVEGRLEEGLPLQVHLTTPDVFGTDWWRTTGSQDHREAFETANGAPGAYATEEALYAAADLSPIPAALREGRGELDAAAQRTLPDLLTLDDLQGSLHNHSTYSDGADTLRAMAESARNLGYTYFGICDHSQSLQIASGLSPEDVRQQQAEIEEINEEFADTDPSFRVFSGIESDVLRDGSLDYEDDLLARFDFVVASIHTGFSMTKGEATKRILRAVRNPHTRILGHPTGRLLLRREGYPIDHDRVIEACAEHDVAIELNGNPYRLDLDWRWVHPATEQGVLISINPDAHSTGELRNVRWGVAAAQKGWLTPDQCLNAKPLSAFTNWIQEGPT